VIPSDARRWLIAAFVTQLVTCVRPAELAAGTLCGTVLDRVSAAPVARAGVFLRETAGGYTGLHGATDEAGGFCISAVPAGTYDVEVRVDDYQVAYLRGVVVTDAPTSVDLPASGLDVRLAPPTPNPARRDCRLRFVLPAPGRARLTVLDVAGREIRAWEGARLAAGEHLVTWNLTDAAGRTVGAGLYFVRLDAGPVRRVRTLIRIP
jgi:hypothetical protein